MLSTLHARAAAVVALCVFFSGCGTTAGSNVEIVDFRGDGYAAVDVPFAVRLTARNPSEDAQTIRIEIVTRPIGADADPENTVVTTARDLSLAGNATETIEICLTLPEGVHDVDLKVDGEPKLEHGLAFEVRERDPAFLPPPCDGVP